jgi:hypothetical protein
MRRSRGLGLKQSAIFMLSEIRVSGKARFCATYGLGPERRVVF